MTYTSRTDALGHECPNCHAEIGEKCVGARGKRRESVHRERMNIAAAAEGHAEIRTVHLDGNKLVDSDGNVLGHMTGLEIDVQTPLWGNLRRGDGVDVDSRTEKSPNPGRGAGETESAQTAMLDDPVDEVWDHYVERLKRPRAKLDAKTRKWIADAIKACGVEECKRAISGLAVSEHHREGGWLGIEYALKPKAGQSIQSRVEMMAAKAPRSAGGSTVVKDLLAVFSPSQRERVASKMLDVRRRNMDPDSSMLKDIGDAAEEWLRVQANIVVVSSEGGQITWGRA